LSDRFEGRSAKLTNRRKLTLKVLQKKGTDQLLPTPHPSCNWLESRPHRQ
jgi:hypothetical protein